MKTFKNITISALTAATLTAIAGAQQMQFTDANLTQGSALEVGASYRFEHVVSGFDAVITIDDLTNATILDIDSSSTNSVANAAWRPTLAGTGGDGLHYADFTVLFYANGTNTPLAPDSFTTTVIGNDLSGHTGSFFMEFAQVAGFTSVVAADGNVDTISYPDGSSLALASADATWLAAWDFENKPGYAIRLGWQGDNGAPSGRTFGTIMDNTTASPTANLVPEPSSVLLIVVSVFPLALRRNRHRAPGTE